MCPFPKTKNEFAVAAAEIVAEATAPVGPGANEIAQVIREARTDTLRIAVMNAVIEGGKPAAELATSEVLEAIINSAAKKVPGENDGKLFTGKVQSLIAAATKTIDSVLENNEAVELVTPALLEKTLLLAEANTDREALKGNFISLVNTSIAIIERDASLVDGSTLAKFDVLSQKAKTVFGEESAAARTAEAAITKANEISVDVPVRDVIAFLNSLKTANAPQPAALAA